MSVDTNTRGKNLDPYRPGMAGCYRCPVNCRPRNDLGDEGVGDRYDTGDGPEYVTLGKFGPNLGVRDPKVVIRLNNICNDLGFDTASMGSASKPFFRIASTRSAVTSPSPEIIARPWVMLTLAESTPGRASIAC